MNSLIDELKYRGLLAQCSDIQELELLIKNPITFYCGFDPTSDSLTIGNLLALITMKRFVNSGHIPIVLVGTLTAMIGDPTGRIESRPMLSKLQVHFNASNIAKQILEILKLNPNVIKFNAEFYQNLSVIDFMRYIASHFSVNEMLRKDCVNTRLDSGGLTFSEMSYALFQAADFDLLFSDSNCILQIGGSDQWGNICSGIDLIRSHRTKKVFGLTFPLVTKSDGTKFGKSSEGNIWLDPQKTTPWEFYNFWINIPDADIEKLFLMFSLHPIKTIKDLFELNKEGKPSDRELQTELALEMTTLVHGQKEAGKCFNVSKALFSDNWEGLTEEEFELISQISGSVNIDSENVSIVPLLVDSGLATSKSDANRLIKSNGITINGETIKGSVLLKPNFFHGKFLILKKGKKTIKIVRRKDLCLT